MGWKIRTFVKKNWLILGVMLGVMLYQPAMDYRAVKKRMAQEEPRRLDELEHLLSHALQPALADLVMLSAQPAARSYFEDRRNPQAFEALRTG